MRTTSLAALAVLAFASTAAAQPLRIHVRVDRPVSKEGFVQPLPADYQDSVKDLRAALAQDKSLKQVPLEQDAAAVILVTERGTHVEPNGGAYSTVIGSQVITSPSYDGWRELRVVIRVGDYETPFSTTCQLWKSCATNIAKPIREWFAANAARLTASRQP